MANSLVGALGAKYPDSKILFADDFEDGFCGWQSLTDSTTPRPPLSLTTDVALRGARSLRIGTGVTGSATKDGYAMGIKRASRIHDSGIVNFDCWWAWGSELAPLAPQQYEFGIDTQANDRSKRSFFRIRYEVVSTTTGLGTYIWRVFDGTNTIDIPGQTNAGRQLFNENKQNWQYMRMSVNLATSKYVELQVGDITYNLAALGVDAGPSDSVVPGFDGGLNFTAVVNNRGSASLCQAWLDIDSARGWYQ